MFVSINLHKGVTEPNLMIYLVIYS